MFYFCCFYFLVFLICIVVITGCSGSRNIADNLSDLKAQIAANQQVSLYKSCSLYSRISSIMKRLVKVVCMALSSSKTTPRLFRVFLW